MKKIYPFFSQNPLDRLDQIRKDEQKVEELKNLDTSIFLLFNNDHIILDESKKICMFTKIELEKYNIKNAEVVLLGEHEAIHYFSINVGKEIHKQLSSISLRDFVKLDYLEEDMFGILAQANAVLNWHVSHKHCSFCGEQTNIMHAGWRRDCPSCKREHFPRTDSVVIMLVTYGEYCLVGRGVNFKEGRYSCLAGYVESGESLEDAARRELFEEAGVIGLEVDYMLSQPWPFPSTLMVGMHVHAKSQELKLDSHEIADAKWVHKSDIKAVLDGKEGYNFTLTDKIAIGRNLLEIWVEE